MVGDIGSFDALFHVERVGIGTGSYPEPPHGWQRLRRRSPNQVPLTGPWYSSASDM